MIDSHPDSPCKGKKVRGSTVEYTGTERGRDSFRIEVVYRQGSWEHKFRDIEFDVRIR